MSAQPKLALHDTVQLKGSASATGKINWIGEHYSQRWYGVDLMGKSAEKMLYPSAQKYVHPMERLQMAVLVQQMYEKNAIPPYTFFASP